VKPRKTPTGGKERVKLSQERKLTAEKKVRSAKCELGYARNLTGDTSKLGREAGEEILVPSEWAWKHRKGKKEKKEMDYGGDGERKHRPRKDSMNTYMNRETKEDKQ